MVNEENIKTNTWIVWLVIICLSIAGWVFAKSDNEVRAISYLVGYSLGSSLLVWGIYYAIYLRKLNIVFPKTISFLAIF